MKTFTLIGCALTDLSITQISAEYLNGAYGSGTLPAFIINVVGFSIALVIVIILWKKLVETYAGENTK